MPDHRPVQGMVGELVRLVTGLSSGAIILVTTFLRDLFPTPVAGLLLKSALGAFALAILAGVFWFYGSLESLAYTEPRLELHRRNKRCMVTMMVSFPLGVLLLSVFTFLNLR